MGNSLDPVAVHYTLAAATDIGGRTANADAAAVEHNPLGVAAAVVDGIGSSPAVVAASRRAADTAAVVASHRGAQAGIMAAADTMPDYPGAPNAVAAVVSINDARIEIAHAGDTAVWTWSRTTGLRRWTVDQTAGEHVAHMLTNPNLTDVDSATLTRLGDAVTVLDDYVLNGLAFATVSTISWTPLRGADADVDLILITSDGVHKNLAPQRIAQIINNHHDDHDHSDPKTAVQLLADQLVATAVWSLPSHGGNTIKDNATAAVIALHPAPTARHSA